MVNFFRSLWSAAKMVGAWLAIEDVFTYVVDQFKGKKDAESDTMTAKIIMRATGQSEEERTMNGTIEREDVTRRACRDGIQSLGETNFSEEIYDSVINLLVAYQMGVISDADSMFAYWSHMGDGENNLGSAPSAEVHETIAELVQLRCAFAYISCLSGVDNFMFDEDQTSEYLSSLMTAQQGDLVFNAMERQLLDVGQTLDVNEDHIISTRELLQDPNQRRVADFFMLMMSAQDAAEGDESDGAALAVNYDSEGSANGELHVRGTSANDSQFSNIKYVPYEMKPIQI